MGGVTTAFLMHGGVGARCVGILTWDGWNDILCSHIPHDRRRLHCGVAGGTLPGGVSGQDREPADSGMPVGRHFLRPLWLSPQRRGAPLGYPRPAPRSVPSWPSSTWHRSCTCGYDHRGSRGAAACRAGRRQDGSRRQDRSGGSANPPPLVELINRHRRRWTLVGRPSATATVPAGRRPLDTHPLSSGAYQDGLAKVAAGPASAIGADSV